MGGRVTEIRNNTPEVLRAFGDAALRTVQRACDETAVEAKQQLVTKGAIDTGMLVESLYVSVTGGKSTYRQAVARAKALAPKKSRKSMTRPGKGRRIAGETKPGGTRDRPSGVVGPAAAHGFVVEHGTARMAARTFMAPASQKVGGRLDEIALEELERRLER